LFFVFTFSPKKYLVQDGGLSENVAAQLLKQIKELQQGQAKLEKENRQLVMIILYFRVLCNTLQSSYSNFFFCVCVCKIDEVQEEDKLFMKQEEVRKKSRKKKKSKPKQEKVRKRSSQSKDPSKKKVRH
jgi:alpha-galactosidase/6-phospho-beta-glucosidase family protein